MRNRFSFLLLLVSLLCLSTPAGADPGGDDFDAGIRAFQRGEYRLAVEHFRRAQAAGLQNPRLDYNLGSAYYRLEDYANSRRHFEKLAAHPHFAALAFYNLGLIANRTGDPAGAIAWFDRCAETTADPELKALAERQIATLGGRPPARGFGYVSAGYGYDSNITLLPSSTAAGESGDFVQALALGEWTLHGDSADGYYLTGLLLSTDYLDSGDFDYDSLTLGAAYRHRAGGWRLGYAVEFGQSSFGGDDYTDSRGLVMNARKNLSDDRELRLRLALEDIAEGSAGFAYLDGSRAELGASYRVEVGRREYRFEYSLEFNDRENTASESFSPTRHRVRLRYFDQVTARTEIGATLEFRESDYKGVPGDERNDERTRLRLEGKHELDRTWTAQAELTYTDNDSSDDASAYHKYQALVSINALF